MSVAFMAGAVDEPPDGMTWLAKINSVHLLERQSDCIIIYISFVF